MHHKLLLTGTDAEPHPRQPHTHAPTHLSLCMSNGATHGSQEAGPALAAIQKPHLWHSRCTWSPYRTRSATAALPAAAAAAANTSWRGGSAADWSAWCRAGAKAMRPAMPAAAAASFGWMGRDDAGREEAAGTTVAAAAAAASVTTGKEGAACTGGTVLAASSTTVEPWRATGKRGMHARRCAVPAPPWVVARLPSLPRPVAAMTAAVGSRELPA